MPFGNCFRVVKEGTIELRSNASDVTISSSFRRNSSLNQSAVHKNALLESVHVSLGVDTRLVCNDVVSFFKILCYSSEVHAFGEENNGRESFFAA